LPVAAIVVIAIAQTVRVRERLSVSEAQCLPLNNSALQAEYL